MAYQNTQATTLASLKDCFNQIQPEIVENVFSSLQGDFEKSFQALSDMQTSVDVQVTLTPEKKLAFLGVVFDKLDKIFVQNVLEKYKWSVEGCLDELLDAEGTRYNKEQQLIRQAELERERREEQQRQQLLQKKREIEQADIVANLSVMFTHLTKQIITMHLQQKNWNVDAAVTQLLPLEQQAQAKEEQARLQIEAQYKAQQEQKLKEEEMRMKKQAEALKADQLENMLTCNNWNELLDRFTEATKSPQTQPQPSGQLTNDQQLMLQVAKDIGYGNIGDSEVQKIFELNQWNLEQAFPVLEKQSITKFKQQIHELFPTLTPEEVEPVIQQVYPDFAAAVNFLRPISQQQQTVALHEKTANTAKTALDEAITRQKQYEKEIEKTETQRKNKMMEFQKLPSGERAFMQTAIEMLQAKENAQITENRKKLGAEVGKRLREWEEAQTALKGAIDNIAASPLPAVPVSSGSSPYLRSAENRHAEFRRILADKRKKIDIEAAKVKHSVISQKLLQELGEQRYSAFLDVVGQAPGGVDQNFERKAFGENKKVVGYDITSNQLDNITKHSSSSVIHKGTQQPQQSQPQQLQQQQLPHTQQLQQTQKTPQTLPANSQPYPQQQITSPSYLQSNPHINSNIHQPQVPQQPLGHTPPHPQVTPTWTPQLPPHLQSQPTPTAPYIPQHSHQYLDHNQSTIQLNTYKGFVPELFLSQHEISIYDYYYQLIINGKNKNHVDASDAEFFRRCRLPEQTLASVWAIASEGKDQLTREQFFLALRLIALAQANRPIQYWAHEINVPLPIIDGIALPTQPYYTPPQFTNTQQYPLHVQQQYPPVQHAPQQQGQQIPARPQQPAPTWH